MKRHNAAVVSTAIAHILAWVVVIGLVFGPVYQGVSVTASAPGAAANEPTKTTATLIEVNGWGVLPILLVPAALTGLALVTILKTNSGQTRHRVLVWVASVLLLGFCILGSFSIGIFYLPSALPLVFSSILVARSRVRASRAG